MDLDSLKIANLEEKFETLIATQQDKIDSLSMIVHDTEIAKSYFASVISLQLGVFLFLVGFIGFFSWKAAANYLKRKIEQSESKTDQKMEGVEESVDSAIKNIEYLEHQQCISFASIFDDEEGTIDSCLWALRACNSAFSKNEQEHDRANINDSLGLVEQYVSEVKNEGIEQDDLEDANDIIQDLSKIKGVDKKRLQKIKTTLNALYYSPDQDTTIESEDQD